jgi:hypothetical protein
VAVIAAWRAISAPQSQVSERRIWAGRRWMAQAEAHLIANRVDTIIETTMRDPGDFADPPPCSARPATGSKPRSWPYPNPSVGSGSCTYHGPWRLSSKAQ